MFYYWKVVVVVVFASFAQAALADRLTQTERRTITELLNQLFIIKKSTFVDFQGFFLKILIYY